MAKLDPQVEAHQEWIGFVKPTGLVVSPHALVRAGAILDRRDLEGQRLLRACTVEREFDPRKGPAPWLPDFGAFAMRILDWNFSPKAYAGTDEFPIPAELEVPLVDYGETLRPSFAVRELEAQDGRSPWQLLVRVLDPGQDPDHVVREGGALEASAQGRMERLLRQTGAPAGLLFNGRVLRLISAPRGESSGWIDFRVADMIKTAGRPICTALRLLLSQSRLLGLGRAERLPALLDSSRKFQNEVSDRLAEQVLHALYELLRGFQAAHDASSGELLREQLVEQPDEVYRALLTVILRLVFLLYAEERDMLPEDETFLRHYSLTGLYERMREDAALNPDTMDQRFGAWPQLLVLFRMIHDGAESGPMRLPKRHGALFDPDRFKFLEGRRGSGARQIGERITPPLLPDGTLYRALGKLLVLDGERISYRALDVEQIGSVYETMMGFKLEVATGRSVAIRSKRKHGAPTAVDLEALLCEPAVNREKWLQDRTDRKLADLVKKAAVAAATLEDLHAALLPVIDHVATPDLVPKGAIVLQPSEERRRSGSHYTPRTLTEPIVRTALEPILARLREPDGQLPRPEQILDLKVCDPAMGSGAFLVEVCRQLGDALVESWHTCGELPTIPPDEREDIFAMRLIAQRCIYGVDRNPVAVDLAKVSLWLVTLAKDHALTFVDHALRHGDSLVGLSRKQIEVFHWDTSITWDSPFRARIRDQLLIVTDLRQRIRQAAEAISDWELHDLWEQVQIELGKVRLLGDLVLAAYFKGAKPKDRERKRSEYVSAVVRGEAERYRDWLEEWRHADPPLVPFHWEIEFPEVFERHNPGFDSVVGNPPYAGNRTLAEAAGEDYSAALRAFYPGSSGRTDLVAFFVRRAFSLLRKTGTAGLLTTNTVAQGDTRRAGLGRVCADGARIYAARRRIAWKGSAAIVPSMIWLENGARPSPAFLDGREVAAICPYLVPGSVIEPRVIRANTGVAFLGCKPGHRGFVLNAEEARDIALRTEDGSLTEYLGGAELYDGPSLASSRRVFCLGIMESAEVHMRPIAAGILRARIGARGDQREWWRFAHTARTMLERSAGLERVIVKTETSSTFAFAFKSTSDCIFSNAVIVICLHDYASFSVLQSRLHEEWARLTSSTLKDDPRYVPGDSFDTFPFPANWESRAELQSTGRTYYEFRSALMVRKREGLTKTYNRFHDPHERDAEILKLRELHATMDRAMLDAYGWSDIPISCDFFLDYEIDEEEWGGKRKPYRLRWPDEVRDEVLARLFELNAARAPEETHTEDLFT
jgi:hypothetical protein